MLTLPESLSQPQRILATDKAALFYIALEDQYGKDNIRRAIARLVHDLAGQEVSDVDLRSALEAATGHDLAEFFRTWLLRPGIPADFRDRYEAQQ